LTKKAHVPGKGETVQFPKQRSKKSSRKKKKEHQRDGVAVAHLGKNQERVHSLKGWALFKG